MHDEPNLERYVRQSRFAPLGEEGQRRLSESAALVCGCGALGSVLANLLARAGVGRLRIVDRDFLELNNLQRQVLYDEADVAAGLPKAQAAAQRLRAINSQVEIEPVVTDVDHRNIESLCDAMDVILDGTDNFETRYLLNDAAAKFNLPWIYGGCIGAEGQTMTIVPGRTACLRCLMPEAPPPGSTPTCDTAGILGGIVSVVAAIQATEAVKLLAGHAAACSETLTVIDLWDNRLRQVGTAALREGGNCPTCDRHEYPWLDGQRGSHSAVLCGRNAVQLNSPAGEPLALDALERKLQGVGKVARNPFLLRLELDDRQLTVFPDGRAIIGGTDDIAEARSLYARYIGS